MLLFYNSIGRVNAQCISNAFHEVTDRKHHVRNYLNLSISRMLLMTTTYNEAHQTMHE